MAKKKEGGTGLAEAIRKAIEVFGPDTGKETTGKIREWIKTQYPGLDTSGASFGTALSGQRKKAREAGGGDGVGIKPVASAGGDTRKARAGGGVEVGNGHHMVAGAAVFVELQKLADKVGVDTLQEMAKLL
jgi:hypothetical protein